MTSDGDFRSAVAVAGLAMVAFSATVRVSFAQVHIVSPAGRATVEGDLCGAFPAAVNVLPGRLQQIHADLAIHGPLMLQAIAWRRDGSSGFVAPGLFDMELLVADSDYSRRSTTFASNYARPPVTAFARKQLQAPNWTTPRFVSSPHPFDWVVPFDQPVAYAGDNDLLWEFKKYRTTNNGIHIADMHPGNAPVGSSARHTVLGAGCLTAAHASDPMQLRAGLTVDAGWGIRVQWIVHHATPSAAAVLLLGLSNPNATVPGLCSTKVYTDGAVQVSGLSATANGWLRSPAYTLTAWPGLVGTTLYAQAVAHDAAQSGLPLAASNGVGSRVPSAGPGGSVCSIHTITGPNAPTGGLADIVYVTEFIAR